MAAFKADPSKAMADICDRTQTPKAKQEEVRAVNFLRCSTYAPPPGGKIEYNGEEEAATKPLRADAVSLNLKNVMPLTTFPCSDDGRPNVEYSIMPGEYEGTKCYWEMKVRRWGLARALPRPPTPALLARTL